MHDGRTVANLVPVTGWRRLLFKGLGWASLGLGAIGVVVPGIPTTPFVLLGGYLFMRSSPELYARIKESRLFGTVLHNYETYGGVTRNVKVSAIGMMTASLGLTVLIFNPSAITIAGLIAVELVGASFIMRLPIVPEQPKPQLAMIAV